jgi:hypothetical protein
MEIELNIEELQFRMGQEIERNERVLEGIGLMEQGHLTQDQLASLIQTG